MKAWGDPAAVPDLECSKNPVFSAWVLCPLCNAAIERRIENESPLLFNGIRSELSKKRAAFRLLVIQMLRLACAPPGTARQFLPAICEAR